jgi:hypothetical protein
LTFVRASKIGSLRTMMSVRDNIVTPPVHEAMANLISPATFQQTQERSRPSGGDLQIHGFMHRWGDVRCEEGKQSGEQLTLTFVRASKIGSSQRTSPHLCMKPWLILSPQLHSNRLKKEAVRAAFSDLKVASARTASFLSLLECSWGDKISHGFMHTLTDIMVRKDPIFEARTNVKVSCSPLCFPSSQRISDLKVASARTASFLSLLECSWGDKISHGFMHRWVFPPHSVHHPTCA